MNKSIILRVRYEDDKKEKIKRGGLMRGFIDDLAGAIYDFLKVIVEGICYFLAGILIIGIPGYLIVWIIDFILNLWVL